VGDKKKMLSYKKICANKKIMNIKNKKIMNIKNKKKMDI